MRVRLLAVLLAAVVFAAACGSDDATDAGGETTDDTIAEAAPEIADDPAPADSDPTQGQVACVYDGDAAACSALEDLGMTAEDNYGLGNSMSQTPFGPLKTDCGAGDALSCAELQFRLDDLPAEQEAAALCAYFDSVLGGGEAFQSDLEVLGDLLGDDAPSGVIAALDTLANDGPDPEALADAEESLSGYIGPICG